MIINGECLSEMKKMESNSISAIVTDPPYGLKFMGKEWDHGIPGVEFWNEALRICKPGSWLLAFGGTRTYHRLTCAIEDAGWEIRDCIMWIYGSGFPKGKGCLKPAYEPIIMARKPGCKVSDNFLNIEECRIEGNINSGWSKSGSKESENNSMNGKNYQRDPCPDSINGRWPANVIFDEEAGKVLDEQSGMLKSGHLNQIDTHKQNKIYGKFQRANCNEFGSNSGGASRFFYCAKASSSERNSGLEDMPLKQTIGGGGTNNTEDNVCGKFGSIKAPAQNFHPTVKPLKLMEYLIKLVSINGGTVLDPFCGSGTTILAAKNLGIDAIGIEMNEEYCEIARKRYET